MSARTVVLQAIYDIAAEHGAADGDAISRRTGLAKSTVSHYLKQFRDHECEGMRRPLIKPASIRFAPAGKWMPGRSRRGWALTAAGRALLAPLVHPDGV